MFAGAGVLGVYAVAFSLVERPTTLLCQLISTATFPMAVRALEREGVAAARTQNGMNGAALLGLALPACIGLALCADQIAAVLAGPAYRAGVASLIPPLAVAALLRNIAAHYLDHAFHLLSRSDLLLAIYAPAAAGNIVLDMLLIPRFGMMGAAAASLIALCGASAAGIAIGHRLFGLWLPAGTIARIMVASLVMAAVLLLFHPGMGAAGLLAKIAAGAGAYGAMAVLLGIGGARRLLCRAPLRPKPPDPLGRVAEPKSLVT
jgi:O-antigen/teichoic acid export membrane protein